MVKYVAYTPSESEYNKQADLAFIKKHTVNGELIKTYVGPKTFRSACNYSLRMGYTLIVAMLNHLGNSPKDIIDIYNRIGADKIICCDCNALTTETIPVIFEHGRLLNDWKITFVQEMTRLRKKKGDKLGNHRWNEFLTHEAQKKGAESNKLKSVNHPANKRAYPEIKRLKDMGSTWQQISDFLNQSGFTTPKGNKWIPGSVLRLWKRHEE